MQMQQSPVLRELPYVRIRPACREIPPALHAAGWEPHPLSTPEQTRRLASAQAGDVGLVCQESAADLDKLPYLNDILAEPRLEWITLLSQEAAAASQVRRLIAESFCDFRTLQLDTARISPARRAPARNSASRASPFTGSSKSINCTAAPWLIHLPAHDHGDARCPGDPAAWSSKARHSVLSSRRLHGGISPGKHLLSEHPGQSVGRPTSAPRHFFHTVTARRVP